MSTESESRTLNDLRVVDLKSELEKRGLDRSGNKQALVERLQTALEEEGLDPKTYQFEGEKKPSKRLSTSNQPEGESKDKLEDSEELEDQPEQNKSEKRKDDSVSTEKMELDEVSIKADHDVSAELEKRLLDDDKIDGGEAEGVIRLTLEEEEEALQDDEIDADVKSISDTEKVENDDKKSASSKNPQEDPTKEFQHKDKTQENKKLEGNNAIGSSSNKASSRSKKSNIQNRNLWITNISQSTRATELKQALSSYGKVIGAKVVINAKYPGACCYGYVTMDTVEDADNCIIKMNNTELNGQIIRIEKVRPDHINSSKLNQKVQLRNDKNKINKPTTIAKPAGATADGEKKDFSKDDKKEQDKRENKSEAFKPDSSTGKRYDSKRSSRGQDRRSHTDNRSRSNSRRSRRTQEKPEILTFDKIKEERERQRYRERDRIIREENRRRHEEAARQREVERMQRSEAARLDREREKLRMERDKLEREKAEIIKLERERQKLEREKLELERLELQRVKLRLQEEDRRAVKRPAPYRRDGSYDERKRVTTDRHYEESPPSPRFDSTGVKPREPTPPKKFNPMVKDYNKGRLPYDKREPYPPKRGREYEPPRSHPPMPRGGPPTTITKYEGSSVFNINRERELHDVRARENSSTIVNSRINKDSRYNERERDRSPHYRSVRDDRDRRPMPEQHKEPPQRFDRNAGGNNWNHPGGNDKGFNSGPPKNWGKDWRPVDTPNNSERWNSGNMSRGTMSGAPFSGNSNMNIGPSCPPPPAINSYSGDRFDYKSIGNIRKY